MGYGLIHGSFTRYNVSYECNAPSHMGMGQYHWLWILSIYDISMMSCNGLWVKLHGSWALRCTHLHSMFLPNGLWYLSFYPFILPNILHTSYVYILPKYVNTSCCTYVLLNHKITYTCFSVLCENVNMLETISSNHLRILFVSLKWFYVCYRQNIRRS